MSPHSLTNPWPWPVRPLYWLYFAADWLDDGDRADHGKVQVDCVIWAALWLHYIDRPLPIAQLMAVLSASFGARMWLAFLKAKPITVTESVEVKEIRGRRVSGTFEATP